MAFDQAHNGTRTPTDTPPMGRWDDPSTQRATSVLPPIRLLVPLRWSQSPMWSPQSPSAPIDKRVRLRVGLLAFTVTPIAMVILYLSVTTMVLASAEGVPLSAYSGAAGLLVSTLLLLLVTLTGVADPTGTYIATWWAAIVAVIMPLAWRPGEPASMEVNDISVAASLSGAFMWSYLPALVFFVFLGGSTSLALVHRWKGSNVTFGQSWQSRGAVRRMGLISTGLGAVFAVGMWAVLLGLAPSDLAPMAIYGARGLTLNEPDLAGVLLACVVAFVFALSSAYSTLGLAFAGVFLMIIPGQIVFPLWMTLTGHLASPSSPLSTSLALVSPIMAALGVAILVVSAPIHFTRLAKETPSDPISAPHSERPAQKHEEAK